MSREKLIKQLKRKNPSLNKTDIENILDIFTESVTNALKNGNSLEIRNLGRWYLKKLKENYNLRNPATNELIYKPDRIKIRFKAFKNLKKKINE